MIANFEHPGVRVTEATRGAIPIERRGFRLGKMVGLALRGPINTPTLISSQGQYHEYFGKRSDASYLDDAVRGWFENVDSPCYVVRVIGAGAAKATATLVNTDDDSVDVLKIDAYGPGTDYNYVASPAKGVSFTYVDGTLTIFDEGVAVEVYHDVVFGNAQRMADFINGNSPRVQITWLSTTANPDNVSVATGLLTGTEGGAITSATYVGSESASPKSGIYAFARKDLGMGFLMCPGQSAVTVGNALIDVAERFRNLAMIDSTFGNSISSAITERNQYASSFGFAVFCYGWVKVADIGTGALKWVPRSPYRAAHIARSHNQPGSIANVGAGTDYVLRNVVALETGGMDDLTQGEINRRGIDVARNFSPEGYGLIHWAARTIAVSELYRFLHVRVIFNVIAQTIEEGLKPFVFRINDGRGRLASEIKGTIDQFLWDLWNGDVLHGGGAKDAFFVKLTSSLAQLEQGIVNVEVYVKPAAIAERINVTLFRVPLAFDFNTGEVRIGDAEQAA